MKKSVLSLCLGMAVLLCACRATPASQNSAVSKIAKSSLSGSLAFQNDSLLNNWNPYQIKRINFISSKVGYISATLYTGQFTDSPYTTERLKTTDGGLTWTKVAPDAILGDSFLNEKDGYAVTPQLELVKTTDGGLTWQKTGWLPDQYITAIQALDQNTIIVGTQISLQGGERLYMTTDGGAHWNKLASPPGEATNSTFQFSFVSATKGYVLGWGTTVNGMYNQPLYGTNDGGRTWRQLAPTVVNTDTSKSLSSGDPGEMAKSIQFLSDGSGFFCSTKGYTMTKDNGAHFNYVSIPSPGSGSLAAGMQFISPQEGFAFTDHVDIRFYHTTDGGKTWNEIKPKTLPPAGNLPTLNQITNTPVPYQADKTYATDDASLRQYTPVELLHVYLQAKQRGDGAVMGKLLIGDGNPVAAQKERLTNVKINEIDHDPRYPDGTVFQVQYNAPDSSDVFEQNGDRIFQFIQHNGRWVIMQIASSGAWFS